MADDGPMTQSIDVRERHVTAFRKTTNLGRKALEHERQLLGSRSLSGGASGWVLFSCAPWSALLERPSVSALPLFFAPFWLLKLDYGVPLG